MTINKESFLLCVDVLVAFVVGGLPYSLTIVNEGGGNFFAEVLLVVFAVASILLFVARVYYKGDSMPTIRVAAVAVLAALPSVGVEFLRSGHHAMYARGDEPHSPWLALILPISVIALAVMAYFFQYKNFLNSGKYRIISLKRVNGSFLAGLKSELSGEIYRSSLGSLEDADGVVRILSDAFASGEAIELSGTGRKCWLFGSRFTLEKKVIPENTGQAE